MRKLLFCVYIYGHLDPKHTLYVCHSLKISHHLDLKNAEFDDFRNFKTTFCKNCLIPGETQTRDVHSRVCINKTGNSCLCVFPLLASVISVAFLSKTLFVQTDLGKTHLRLGFLKREYIPEHAAHSAQASSTVRLVQYSIRL